MCEILTLKYNKKGIYFTKNAIEDALRNNSDGAGYAVLQKTKNGWDVIEENKFHLTSPRRSFSKLDEEDWNQSIDYQNFLQEYPEYSNYHPNSYISLMKLDNRYQKIADELFERQFYLKPSQILIMHFRLATKGFSAQSAQPIVNGSYMVIHNGIIRITGEKEESDTLSFTRLINSKMDFVKSISVEKEREIIEKTLKDLGGYWSMYVYSWKTKQLYYFKNDLATFYESMNGIVSSTNIHRFPTMYEPAESHIV